MTDLKQLGQQAKEASYTLGLMDTRQKNTLLNKMAAAIEANAPRILQANALDLSKPLPTEFLKQCKTAYV